MYKICRKRYSWSPSPWGWACFGVARIFASFNDTFVHVTDLTGRETITRVTGGMKVKADHDESSPYAAMLAAQDVAARCKEVGINALHFKIRATGGTGTKTLVLVLSLLSVLLLDLVLRLAVLRTLPRSLWLYPQKGGRRGRRL